MKQHNIEWRAADASRLPPFDAPEQMSAVRPPAAHRACWPHPVPGAASLPPACPPPQNASASDAPQGMAPRACGTTSSSLLTPHLQVLLKGSRVHAARLRARPHQGRPLKQVLHLRAHQAPKRPADRNPSAWGSAQTLQLGRAHARPVPVLP